MKLTKNLGKNMDAEHVGTNLYKTFVFLLLILYFINDDIISDGLMYALFAWAFQCSLLHNCNAVS